MCYTMSIALELRSVIIYNGIHVLEFKQGLQNLTQSNVLTVQYIRLC